MVSPRNYLIWASAIAGLFGAAGVVPALGSFRSFSVPGAGFIDHVIGFAIYLFPVSCGLGILFAWVLYFSKRYRPAMVVIHLPLLNLVLGGFYIAPQLLADLPETFEVIGELLKGVRSNF